MKNILKNSFLSGLIAALSVVIADFLNHYVINPGQPFSWQAIAVAAAIATVGFIGKFLTGVSNTIAAMFGSAVIAIVPLITTGHINWQLVFATFALKLLGLLSSGSAAPKDTEPKMPYKTGS